MKFDIVPYVSAGCINFGMKREEIRKHFNNKFEEFKKTPLSENTTDDFGCCHIYYNKKDTCEAIEFFEEAEVLFNGSKLLEIPYSKARDIFVAIDSQLNFNESGFISYKYGIGFFAPYADEEPDESVESVIVFRKGYYD